MKMGLGTLWHKIFGYVSSINKSKKTPTYRLLPVE